jgi:RNA-directed DNA polymerase
MDVRTAECARGDKPDAEESNRSGRIKMPKQIDTRGDHRTFPSPFPVLVGDLMDESTTDAAPFLGHQGKRKVPEHGSETRTDSESAECNLEAKASKPGRASNKRRKKAVQKAHSLIDKVYRWENLYRAYKRVWKNKGVHGLDRVTLRMFDADWEKHLTEIQRKLMQRRYQWQPVMRVYIPKGPGSKEKRPLGIPVVADRIVGQALIQVIEPIFDDTMSDRSFAYRKGRRAHHAIATAIQDGRDGYKCVLDADISACFDQMDHNVVMSFVRARIADGRVLDLFEAYLKAGVYEDGTVHFPERGFPQGGVISPWLMNLVLDDLDKAIESRGLRHVRYADDFLVLCHNRIEAEQALSFVKEVLKALKLLLNTEKTRISSFHEGFEFLGFRFRRSRLGIRPKAIDKFKDKIRKLTRRQQGRNIDAVIKDLVPVLRGWARYFGVAEVDRTFRALDAWIRMRLRAFKFKRKNHNDNWRLPNRRLAKWGFLSLQKCRPKERLSMVGCADRRGTVVAPCDEEPARGRLVS